jgi:hypothetical protein
MVCSLKARHQIPRHVVGCVYPSRLFGSKISVDSVKQEVRCSDIHLGRLVGDDCRRLMIHGCRSAE